MVVSRGSVVSQNETEITLEDTSQWRCEAEVCGGGGLSVVLADSWLYRVFLEPCRLLPFALLGSCDPLDDSQHNRDGHSCK